MKRIQKVVFVSYNGAEFDNAEDCLAHEMRCAWTEHIYARMGRNPEVDDVWEYIRKYCNPTQYPEGFVEPGGNNEQS